MTYSELSQVVRRFHEAKTAWGEAVNAKTLELVGKVPDDAFAATLLTQLKDEQPEVYAEVLEATIAQDQALAALRLREVEAHEEITKWRSGEVASRS